MNSPAVYIKASFWATAIRLFFMIGNFFGQIILARILLPESFGTMALAVSIAAILSLLFSYALDMSYIYLPDSETLMSSALFVSVLSWLSLNLVSLLIFLPIQHLYGTEIAIFILIISFVKIFGFVGVLLLAKLEKNVDFKVSSFIIGTSGFLSLIIAIIFAYYDFDVVSLLLREISGPILVFVLAKIYTKQTIDFKSYNLTEVKRIFNYSIKILFSRSSEQLYVRVPFVIIGTYFDKNILGYISQMFYLSNLFNQALSTFNGKVAFVFFTHFEKTKKVKKGLFYINLLNIVFGIPVFIVFYYYPSELLGFMWGDKWIEGSEFLKLLAVFAIILPINNSLKSYFYGHGKNNIVTIGYIFSLAIYLICITIWQTNEMLAMSFSISMFMMLVYMSLKVIK